MSVIHIATPDGRKEVYPEDQVQEIWREGYIPEASLYWQAGMTDWRPAADYFSNTPRVLRERAEAAPANARYCFTRDPAGLTHLLKILLLVSMILQVVSLASYLT